MKRKINVYTASCLQHAKLWTELRQKYSEDFHFTSHWMDQILSGAQETPENARKFWARDVQEVQSSDAVIVYAVDGDILRGAICEAGVALGCGIPVIIVAPAGLHSLSTWQYHPLAKHCLSLTDAFEYLWDLFAERHQEEQ